MRPPTRLILSVTLTALASPAAHAACALKDLFPSGVYTYRMSGPTTITYTTTNAAKSSSVTSTTTVAGTTTSMTWACTAKGLTGTMSTGGKENLTTTSSAFLPPPSVWRPGYSWKSNQTVNMGGGLTAKSTSVNKIVKRESIKVPAGTFTAWRLDTTSTMTMKLPNSSAPKTTTLKSSVWYAPGTGMIRSESSGVTTELVKVKR
ncbi:TapB family protein [Deinococcus radiotolerans]|uniref:DUF3108 domain-containing protein n=1 Tax=Deinococcus radiotolerans TaxID=1309407 RepID=A0ABQ2FFV7_9DEIO|nr:hypothetical protein [Deinococcus radiotolerans]GGK92271.1 hypothetical protein GCM10010844_08480 [Deinococcus radiotolerans]